MRKVQLVLAALAVVLCSASVLWAQTATGQITGTVKDASGGVMPKVKVTVTNQQTGLTRETTTNDDGTYVVPLLPVGTYLVTAEQTGFKLAISSDIPLNVDQVQRIDLELAAGNVSEKVEVKANAASIDTQTSTIGQVVSEKQVTDLPLNGRNFIQLLFLGAGAVMTDGEQGAMRQGVGSAISIMGARPTSNNFMLDGTANMDTSLGTRGRGPLDRRDPGVQGTDLDLLGRIWLQLQPDQHRQQVRHEPVPRIGLRLHPQRESGRAQLLRSARCGEAQAAIRSSRASSSAAPSSGNKTFFLVNYEGVRIKRGFSSFNNVPTPDELAGHFTSTIIDPATGQPFPNNTIPASRFSRLAQLAVEQVRAGAEHQCATGQLPGDPDAATGSGSVHHPRRSQSRPVRDGVRALHEYHLQQHFDRQRQRPRRHGL